MSQLNQSQLEQFQAYLDEIVTLPDAASIWEELRQIRAAKPLRIRIKVLYSPKSDLVAELAYLGARGLHADLAPTGPGFRFTIPRSDNRAHKISFAVLPTAHDRVHCLVTVSQRDPWNALLSRLRSAYPRIVPVLLSQRELLGGLENLRKELRTQYSVMVRELSLTEELQANDGGTRRTLREWTMENWESALDATIERKQTLRAVSLDFLKTVGGRPSTVPTLSCRINKRAEIDCTGSLDLLFDTAVSYFAGVGSRKLAFFSKRGLRETAFKARPIDIKYNKPLFKSDGEVKRLVTVLQGYPRAMHSLQHGNPYAFVRVTDSFDGSCFDVWAVSEDAITIVPRLKASEAAVDRLVQYVFDEFREGQLVNHATL